jgi:uncharacterized protein
MPYLSERKDGAVLLAVHVQPKASRSAVCGVHGSCLKIAVASPPVDGKANEAVIVLLAGLLKTAKRNISLQSGPQSRKKQFVIVGKTLEEIRGDIRSVLGP